MLELNHVPCKQVFNSKLNSYQLLPISSSSTVKGYIKLKQNDDPTGFDRQCIHSTHKKKEKKEKGFSALTWAQEQKCDPHKGQTLTGVWGFSSTPKFGGKQAANRTTIKSNQIHN